MGVVIRAGKPLGLVDHKDGWLDEFCLNSFLPTFTTSRSGFTRSPTLANSPFMETWPSLISCSPARREQIPESARNF